VSALEALPHGFARTKSGVEIKLIKKAFTQEEVWLAGQLTRLPESAAEIAKRVGLDELRLRPRPRGRETTPRTYLPLLLGATSITLDGREVKKRRM
jgi:hypothetical protein